MRSESGVTLPELLLMLALAALVVATTAAYSVPWIAREAMRSAVYDVQTSIQTARIEAVTRNRDVYFVIDTTTGDTQVLDTMGTVSTTDDTLLHETRMPSSVSLARPDTGLPVTLAGMGGSLKGTVFDSEGTVTAGTGEVVMLGGTRYGRITVFAAGGLQVDRWNGSAWETGL